MFARFEGDVWASFVVMTLIFGLVGIFSPRQLSAEEWIGKDKFLHFTLSMSAVSAIYFIEMYADTPGSVQSKAVLASAIVMGGGIGKEMLDLACGKVFSGKDVAWDILGLLTGLGLSLGLSAVLY